MHNIEIRTINGIEVASFAENGKRERAWHGLGNGQQIFDRPMFVAEALKACNADYKVQLQPLVALNDKLVNAMENNEMISGEELSKLLVPNKKATMRMDLEQPLGVTSDNYGLVQNIDAFKFVDMFCSGKSDNRDNTPVIETCGVFGNGERVFVTAKFPTPIVVDAKRDDLIEMYVVFTTSHDGTGAVRCVCSPVRVVCNNTMRLALSNNIGSLSFRHSPKIMSRLDLLKEENEKFAYDAMGLATLYEKEFKESYEHLRSINLNEKDVDNIIAEITLGDKAKKIFLDTKNLYHNDIGTKGRNIFIGIKNYLDNGVGQDYLERGTAEWLLNGITSYYQNVQSYKNKETKFNSILDGLVAKKVQKAYDMMLLAA